MGYMYKAIDMFKRLGYRCTRNDFDYIIYEKPLPDDESSKVVSFCNQNQSVNVHYDFQHGEQVPSIDVEPFKAISIQLNELKWIQI